MLRNVRLPLLILLFLAPTGVWAWPHVVDTGRIAPEVIEAGRAGTNSEVVSKATHALSLDGIRRRSASLARAIRGMANYRLGHYKSAAFDLRRARLKGKLSINDTLFFFEGESYFHSGRYSDALAVYEKMPRLFRSSPWRHRSALRAADCLIGQRKFAKAVKAITKKLDEYPDFPYKSAAYIAIAEAERGRNRLKSTFRWLRRVVRSWPNDPLALEAQRAVEALEAQGFRAPKESADTRYRQAYDLRRRKYFNQAVAIFDALIAAENTPAGIRWKAAYQRGRALYQMERFDDALAQFNLIIASKPSAHRVKRALKWKSATLERLTRFDDAADVLLGNTKRPSGSTLSDIGWLYFNGARYEKAKTYFDRLADRGGNWPRRTRWMRTWLAYRLGDYKGAVEGFKRLQRSSKARPARYGYWLARTLIRMGELDAAEDMFKGIVTSSPLSYYAYQSKARLKDLGRPFDDGPAIVATNADGEDPESSNEAPEVGAGCTENEDGDEKGCLASEVVATTPHEEVVVDELGDPEPEVVAAEPDPLPDSDDAVEVLYQLQRRWGRAVPYFSAAFELAVLGEDRWATLELRKTTDEMRVYRDLAKGEGDGVFRPHLYVDNRKVARAEWGHVYDLAPPKRAERDRRFMANGKSRKFYIWLRDAYTALGDHYYARRHHMKEDRVHGRPEDKATKALWRRKYPRAYRDVVESAAARFGLDPYLLWALMTVESRYNPWSISRVGARGLMQVMPHTGGLVADRMGARSYGPDQMFEPEVIMDMAAWYFHQLLTKFNGQTALAIGSYNAGPHRQAAWLSRKGHLPMDEFIEEIPYTEAREYTKKVLRYLSLYRRIYGEQNDFRVVQVIDPNFRDNINF